MNVVRGFTSLSSEKDNGMKGETGYILDFNVIPKNFDRLNCSLPSTQKTFSRKAGFEGLLILKFIRRDIQFH